MAPALVAASSAVCDDAASTFAVCTSTSGQGEVACLSCVDNYVPATVETCIESELYTCSAMEACPECGNCEAEFTAMVSCDNQGYCGTITCSAAAPTPPSISPAAAAPTAPQEPTARALSRRFVFEGPLQ